MSFLIRAAFWLSLVILILPADPGSETESAKLSTTEALTAAQATLKDFTSFCTRQPDVCAAGEVAIENFSAKARYGAKQLYMYLDGDSEKEQPIAQNQSVETVEGLMKEAKNEVPLPSQELEALLRSNQ
ncbi:DUF5330 domain-containing protein [uncultured Cohaesibacter sp.]|uniref:DUF5330 domain-containing protein n=1 Tax=uncultured Cohaesibacter sp. TaxID=1002546 RepID=UPI00292D3255|nr:DUF5330 domain-containing protein [uncultured Cohaesibacter sp.]